MFKYGEKVKIDRNQFNDDKDWEGIVVGVALKDLFPLGDLYIVKVTSGQIPNATYEYDTCAVTARSIWKSETNAYLDEWISNVKVGINSCPYIEENEQVLPSKLTQEVVFDIQRKKNRAIKNFIGKTGEEDIVAIFTKVFGDPNKVFNWTSIWTFSNEVSILYACVDTHKGILWEYDKTYGTSDIIPLIHWCINQINQFDLSQKDSTVMVESL